MYENSLQVISTRWTLCKNINFVQNKNIKWNLSIQPYRKYESILFLSGSPITFRILLPNSDARILKKTKSFAEQLCLVFCTGSYTALFTEKGRTAAEPNTWSPNDLYAMMLNYNIPQCCILVLQVASIILYLYNFIKKLKKKKKKISSYKITSTLP